MAVWNGVVTTWGWLIEHLLYINLILSVAVSYTHLDVYKRQASGRVYSPAGGRYISFVSVGRQKYDDGAVY